jgi:spermidine/putrescine transport system substrate-binding protein
MKKIISFFLLVSLILSSLLIFSSCGSEVRKFYIYNWGEYMPLGDEGGVNVPKEFEAYYNATHEDKIKVVYSIFSSNEDMYAKLKNGTSKVDLIIPSDYMVARLITENMLHKLDFENIPNYSYIDAQFKNTEGNADGPHYDPTCEYSVPYTYGTVGLIYNTTMVDEEDVDTWRVLWNEKYTGMILNFNNSRDAFGIAQYILSYETGHNTEEDNYVNTADKARWDESLSLLQSQRPYMQAYVMDEVYNKMESGAAALAPYYAGDFYTMQEVNEDLAFSHPKEGSNIFVDAMCVPAASKNRDIAEEFINFVLEPEWALEIAEYICYSCPNTAVTTNEEYSFIGDEILYPDTENLTFYYFESLDTETLRYANSLWEKLKVESSSGTGIYVFASVIILGCIALALFLAIKKRKLRKYY